jgi:macrophage erythroblast attacher
MDENNPPLVLPNGHAYSQHALQEQAAGNSGHVTCPSTGLVCSIQALQAAYII